MNVKIFPVTQNNSELGSCTWKTHDVDLTKAWQDTNYLHAPFKDKSMDWATWASCCQTLTRVRFIFDVGDTFKCDGTEYVVKWVVLKSFDDVTDEDATEWGFKESFENCSYDDGSPSRDWQTWSPSENFKRTWIDAGQLPWVWVVGLTA